MFASRQMRSVFLAIVLGTAPLIVEPVQAQAVADQTELAFWDTVRSTQDRAMLQLYLDSYPEGAFAPLAHLMIAQLQQGAGLVQAAPSSTAVPVPSDAMRLCQQKAYHPWDEFASENIGKPAAEEVADLEGLLANCRTAAETGDAEAQFHLYRVSAAVASRAQQSLSEEGWQALENAAAQEHELAQLWLARHLLRQIHGDRRDTSRGLSILSQMTDKGSAVGALELGSYHAGRSTFYSGRDGAYDYALALTYLKKSEALGDQTMAAYYLGSIYGDKAFSGFDVQAAAAAYDRAIATGKNQIWSHGKKGLLLATEGLNSARDWPPEDIVSFFHGGMMMEGLAALRQASQLEMVDTPGYWTRNFFRMFQDAFNFAANYSRSKYENNYLSWRGSEEGKGLDKVLLEMGEFMRDELSALNAAQPGTYFGLGTDDLQEWLDQFEAIRDDQLRMFAELNEVKGWNLTFVAANECVDEMNGNATIGTGWIEYKYRNNCPAPVNILMQVEFDKNTAGDREQLYRTRLDPDEVFQRKFYAESDGSNSVTARLASCYDKQEGPSLYPDGKTYGCDWAFELDETDLVRDYRARRDSLVDHLDAVLSDVVGD